MLDDLDRSLRSLMARYLPPDLAGRVTISFERPDDKFPAPGVTRPALDFFLYDVRENCELRSTEWSLHRQSDATAQRRPPPVRVDCSYLITAWPGDTTASAAQDEHRLLSAAMTVLLRFSTLPEEVLQGALAVQELPLPTTALQPGHLQSLGEFWQAMGGRPKAALHYSVTVAVQPFPAVEVPLVRETQTGLQPHGAPTP